MKKSTAHERTGHATQRTSKKASGGAHAKAKAKRPVRRWSKQVTEHSDAMDLEPDVFKLDNPHAIAESLLSSAKKSHRRKASPMRSAMSMLTFYVNRAGKGLSASRKDVLARAKDELRQLGSKDPATAH